MGKKSDVVSEETWSAIMCGVVVSVTGDRDAVTVHASKVSRADAVRLVDVAWHRRALWPCSGYVASCDFMLNEREPGLYDVTLWADGVKS